MKTLRILKLIGLCLVNFETFIANCGAKECDPTQTKEALGHTCAFSRELLNVRQDGFDAARQGAAKKLL